MESAAAILEIFSAFHQVGVTVIIATHDPHWMAHLSPRVLRLERGGLPATPEGEALLRTSYMATHTYEILDEAMDIIQTVLKFFLYKNE